MGNKKRRVSEQEQLASKLDKALSLTKLGKLNKVSCKFVEGSPGKSRATSGSRLPVLPDIDGRNKMGKSSLSKDLSLFHKSSKGGKGKMTSKSKPSDSRLKGKGQRKSTYSPMRSEISSYSNSKLNPCMFILVVDLVIIFLLNLQLVESRTLASIRSV